MSKFRSNEPSLLSVFWTEREKKYTFKCLFGNGENTRVYDGTRFPVELPLSESGYFFVQSMGTA